MAKLTMLKDGTRVTVVDDQPMQVATWHRSPDGKCTLLELIDWKDEHRLQLSMNEVHLIAQWFNREAAEHYFNRVQ